MSCKIMEKKEFWVLENHEIWSLQVLEEKHFNVCMNPEGTT